jgi:hypothetical protein
MWTWFFEIRGSGNRVVKRDGVFNTKEQAIAVGTSYVQNNKENLLRPNDPEEIFIVMAKPEWMARSQ